MEPKLELPNIGELATMYKKALASSDHRLVGVAEAAMMRVAIAHAHFSEAAVMRSFLAAIV